MRTLALLLFMAVACIGPVSPTPPAPAPAPAAVHLLVEGKEAPVHDPQVLSVDDANENFQATLGTSPDVENAHTLVLMLGDASLRPNSWGRSGEQGYVVVPATAAQARALAAALGVPVRERPAWPLQLAGRLEQAGTIAAGAEHVPLQFHLTNKGNVALWFMDGGRGRNELGRDNRFTFAVERDGQRLATRQLHDFGGLGVYRQLLPEGSWTFELDLAHWVAFDKPGKYTVHSSYEAELMPADYVPAEPLPPGWHSHLRRTRKVEAELVLTVR